MAVAYNITVYVSYEQAFAQMICHTHHRYMDALHYACIYAPSNYAVTGMIYYTYHTYMEAPLYVPGDET
jgi:hypothetical protein